MQDFAYLFSDSAAAWLRGRGDARFHQYERFYRAGRASAQGADGFDLERSNEQYASFCRRSGNRLVQILDSKRFRSLMLFLVILWGGSLLLPTVGKSQPAAFGVVLCAVFVGMRVRARRGRSKSR
ncbi:hypothetical protein ParKJ_34470 [Paraburkholderia fungorum]|jgi:hypothetical protein|uniref:Uncharacterized protein n=1 Tax=Paraburkholderia fungorum TaxID=134537 RepID=A0AAP5QHZ0_9BURK|nr:hypothetical protein [Paraburkholderia fungorum]MDT8842542.1 hypothetical protein [Paraburkholderia fungorum]